MKLNYGQLVILARNALSKNHFKWALNLTLISDEIKNALFAKASEKIDALRPVVATAMFDQTETESEEE